MYPKYNQMRSYIWKQGMITLPYMYSKNNNLREETLNLIERSFKTILWIETLAYDKVISLLN